MSGLTASADYEGVSKAPASDGRCCSWLSRSGSLLWPTEAGYTLGQGDDLTWFCGSPSGGRSVSLRDDTSPSEGRT